MGAAIGFNVVCGGTTAGETKDTKAGAAVTGVTAPRLRAALSVQARARASLRRNVSRRDAARAECGA